VRIVGPSAGLDPLGLVNGDVVVAIGGWQVESPAELACASQLAKAPELRITAWRGDRYVEVPWPSSAASELELMPLGRR